MHIYVYSWLYLVPYYNRSFQVFTIHCEITVYGSASFEIKEVNCFLLLWLIFSNKILSEHINVTAATLFSILKKSQNSPNCASFNQHSSTTIENTSAVSPQHEITFIHLTRCPRDHFSLRCHNLDPHRRSVNLYPLSVHQKSCRIVFDSLWRSLFYK